MILCRCFNLVGIFNFCCGFSMDVVDSSPSSSSSSDDDELINQYLQVLGSETLLFRPKMETYAEETVPLFSGDQFMETFRISKQRAGQLAEDFALSEYYPDKDTGHVRIVPFKCILVWLSFAGHEGKSFRELEQCFDLAISKIHDIIVNVTMFLSGLGESVITWPTEDEKGEILTDFENRGFPGVLGCIDGTHIKIDAPSENSGAYFNKDKEFSIQMQAVCDSQKKIRDVFIGYPGSVHDRRVYRNSPLSDTLAEKCGNHVILGDGAYPCLRNLIVPFRDNGHLNGTEKAFNTLLGKNRVFIEHTFGMLKQKFRALYHLKLRSVELMCHFIRACCVVHNLAIDEDFHYNEFVLADRDIHDIDEEDNAEGDDIGINYRNYLATLLINA